MQEGAVPENVAKNVRRQRMHIDRRGAREVQVKEVTGKRNRQD
jgi:hypothetical protein